MGTLAGFLKENRKEIKTEKYVASPQFVDENGKPLEWDIQTISCKKDEDLRKESTKQTKNGTEFDYDKYTLKLCVACITSPNLNAVELQNSYGVMGAEELLSEMLLPGELQKLKIKVQEVNGYGETLSNLVEEAKN